MTRYAGATAEILLRRVRESGDTGIPLSFAMQMLSHCQRLANAGLRSVKSSGSFATTPQQLIYPYREQLTDAVDIISITDGNRTLTRLESLSELQAYSSTWWRDITGTQHEFWKQLGRDLLLIYPGEAAADSLTVYYTTLTTDCSDLENNYNDALELPDEQVDIALGFAEILLNLKTRNYDAVDKRLAMLNKTLMIEVGATAANG